MSMKSEDPFAPPAHDPKVAVSRAFDEMNNRAAGASQNASPQSSFSQQPLLLVLAATALGYFVGTSLPMSRRERDNVGPLGDRLGARAKTVANDLVDDAKEAAMNAVAGAFGSGRRK